MKTTVSIYVSVSVLVIGFCCYWAIKDERAWEKFKIDHECRVIKTVKPQTLITFVDGKVGTIIVPGAVTYACNNGQEYTLY